ncbi:MAG: hypothetical protein CMM49_02310 [Rhodospirillaceae bacterium]|nr:hypothetical protein [Rhodospirillaceae bacterium]|tara:strand:- start:53972 stop:54208 length:237 start_codon:yes stop_codon:yes gene_type:complete
MPDWLDRINGWISKITEIVLALIALGVVLQILFGRQVVFLPGDIVGNLTGLIQQLGDSGLVGLIALAILLYLYNKRQG